MSTDIFLWHVLRIITLPKILLYRVIYKVRFPFGSIIHWYPKIRYGKLMSFGKNFQLWRLCRLQWKIQIGERFFMNEFWTISAGCTSNSWVIIGDNVMIGPFLFLVSWDHGFSHWENFNVSNGWKHADIQIGDNVWIGARVTILKWVKIGDNVVLWAGSVVTKDIPSNSLAVWNPCKVKKQI